MYSNSYVTGVRTLAKVFVYGTLLKDWHNHHWAGQFNPKVIPAKVKARLFWAYTPGSFPACVNDMKNGYDVVGEILEFDPRVISMALQSMDRLEGYRGPSDHNHYDRMVKVAVDEQRRKHLVYIYCYRADVVERYVQQGLEIPAGSWAAETLVQRYSLQ